MYNLTSAECSLRMRPLVVFCRTSWSIVLLDLAYLSHKSDEACRTASYSNSEGDHGVNEDGVVQLRYILPLFWSDISQRCAGGLETLEELHTTRQQKMEDSTGTILIQF